MIIISLFIFKLNLSHCLLRIKRVINNILKIFLYNNWIIHENILFEWLDSKTSRKFLKYNV